jgi:hypothetical protein
MQKSHFRLWALLGGTVVLLLALAGLWKVQSAPVDTALTPAHLAIPLASTADRYEVLVAGVPLQKAIADKRLMLAGENGAAAIVVPEATVRVNEAGKVRAARVPSLLALSAIAGGALVLLLVGVFTPRIGLIDMHLEAL